MRVEAQIVILRSTLRRPISVRAFLIDNGFRYIGQRPHHDTYHKTLPIGVIGEGEQGVINWFGKLAADLIDANTEDIGVTGDFKIVTEVKTLGHFPPHVDEFLARREEVRQLNKVKDVLMGIARKVKNKEG